MRRNQTIEEQLSPAASAMQFGISGRGERRTGGLHSTKPAMHAAQTSFCSRSPAGSSREQPQETRAQLGTQSPAALREQRPDFSAPRQNFWPAPCEPRLPGRHLPGAAPASPPRPASALGCSGLARCARRSAGGGARRLTLSRTPARPPLPPPRPRAAPPAMSRGSRLALAVSALLSAAIVAAVHIQQRRELERLRSGVVRDLERQKQKKENIRLLEEQIALTKQLTEERDKALMEKRSQQS
ncbi:uncharacterized protein LOC121365301 [Pyrgilauda ruficollis]|uniref:uncharacterized protein LOC121365301 n=2 Tax=Passeridae TaxID=9158 RepID=UPI001B88399E|nr:uncharacterized protein LOC121365301 [Pyrgilauda ruficollis]